LNPKLKNKDEPMKEIRQESASTETMAIVDGRFDSPEAPRLVLSLPHERRIIDTLCNEQRIYCCGSPQEIEYGCGNNVYHLLESSTWQSDDWWRELHQRVEALRAEDLPEQERQPISL
jgi:hypothetical protein